MGTPYHYKEIKIGSHIHRYRQEWIGNIELRFEPEDDEDLDEVCLRIGYNCSLHLERMDDHYIWMGLTDGDHCIHLNFGPSENLPCDCRWDNSGSTPTVTDADGDVWIGPVRICHTKAGVFDEVFFTKDDHCYLHVERLAENTIWMHVNDGEKGVHLFLGPTERHECDVADWDEDAGNDEKLQQLVKQYESGAITQLEFANLALEQLTDGDDLDKLPTELCNQVRSRVESLPADDDEQGWSNLVSFSIIASVGPVQEKPWRDKLRRGVCIARAKWTS